MEALRRLRNFDVPVTRQTGSAGAPSDSPLHCTLRVSSGSWMDHRVLPFIPERATTVTEGLETPVRGRKESERLCPCCLWSLRLSSSSSSYSWVAQASHIHTAWKQRSNPTPQQWCPDKLGSQPTAQTILEDLSSQHEMWPAEHRGTRPWRSPAQLCWLPGVKCTAVKQDWSTDPSDPLSLKTIASTKG